MTAGAALSRELRFTGTSVPPSLGSTEKRLEGPEAFGLRVRQAVAVFAGTPVPAGLASQAFGTGRWRCSGPRAGGRPSIKGRFLRERSGEIGWHASHRPGTEKPFRGPSVRRRKPGCPAYPGFRREGAGRASTLTFSARTASPPRVGRPTDPGPRGSLVELREGFTGQGRYPQGRRPGPGGSPQGAALEAWKRQPVRPAPPTVRTGSLGTLPAPRDGPGRCP
jgi:hypothetical protein